MTFVCIKFLCKIELCSLFFAIQRRADTTLSYKVATYFWNISGVFCVYNIFVCVFFFWLFFFFLIWLKCLAFFVAHIKKSIPLERFSACEKQALYTFPDFPQLAEHGADNKTIIALKIHSQHIFLLCWTMVAMTKSKQKHQTNPTNEQRWNEREKKNRTDKEISYRKTTVVWYAFVCALCMYAKEVDSILSQHFVLWF